MSARTPDEVSRTIREKLNTTLPGLSLEVGTVERKIVDACSEAISEASVGQYISGSSLDIETKSGSELEQFVGIFGFGRLQGRRATGLLRMELKTIATQPVQVQSGTRFSVQGRGPGGTPLDFVSVQSVAITPGSYSVDVPIQCTVVGSIGNVPPGSITSLSSSIGTASVSNLTATSGGIDPENDDELRARFRNTFLRNISGTEDFYKALCLQNNNVSRVAVYGPTSLYRTQVPVSSPTTTISVDSDVKYVWRDSELVFHNLAQEDEVFYSRGTDYTFLPQKPPAFTLGEKTTMKTGEIVDVEFEYTTESSRNDPANGLTNKVDIFVNGVDPVLVTEKTYVTNLTFNATGSSERYINNFVRFGTNTPPESGNRFMRLGSMPLVSFPSILTLNGVTYTEGVHYFVVRGTTSVGGSEREVGGLEWTSSGAPTGTEVLVSYTYNRTPELLNSQLKSVKQITTDVLVRQSKYTFLKVYLSVEYHRNYSILQTNNAISDALKSFFSQTGYGDWIEESDILSIVHSVPGVDNVWLTKQSENSSNYGIEEYWDGRGVNKKVTQTQDFKLRDNQLPIFLDVKITRKANR